MTLLCESGGVQGEKASEDRGREGGELEGVLPVQQNSEENLISSLISGNSLLIQYPLVDTGYLTTH